LMFLNAPSVLTFKCCGLSDLYSSSEQHCGCVLNAA
jgi:hypothetical protein